jgi:membrane dipeptidase
MSHDHTKKQFGNYDFGLTDQQEARASKLHSESIIADLLYWGPCTYLSYTQEMEKEIDEMFEATHDIDYVTFMGVYQAQIHASYSKFPEFKEAWDASGVTAGSRMVEFGTWEVFAGSLSRHIAMFDKLPWVLKVLKADDIRQAKAEGKHAAWLHTQLGTGISKNFIDLIGPSYDLGLRIIQLTYNPMNLIGAGCAERTDAGVTYYGAKVIALMNKLGMLVDTGHCGRLTTLDACKLSAAPVIASHTTAEGVYKHARAKSDEELHAIAKTGGVIGVNTVAFFHAPPAERGLNI